MAKCFMLLSQLKVFLVTYKAVSNRPEVGSLILTPQFKAITLA